MRDVSLLDRIDWDFPSSGTRSTSLHAAYTFPGNFIPQIPARLISALSKRGDLVLDPFCGSGTTGVEAVNQGRNAVCSDIVRASVLIAEAKLCASTRPVDAETRHALMTGFAFPHLCRSSSGGSDGSGTDPRLTKWFAPDTLAQLRYVWRFICEQSEDTRAALAGVFATMLFSCAAPGFTETSTGKQRRHHWGWIADNVAPKALSEHDVASMFIRRLELLPRPVALQNSQQGCGIVVRQDARELALADQSVDLIVTSPPYIGVIDYTRAHRLLYLWLGWNLDAEKIDEIGARYKRHRKHIVDEYQQDMVKVWAELGRVLKPGGHFAIVLGESRKFAGSAQISLDVLAASMELAWGPTRRTPTRRRVADRSASDFHETVTVFKRRPD